MGQLIDDLNRTIADLRRENAAMRELLGKLAFNTKHPFGDYLIYSAHFTDDDIRSLCWLTGRALPEEIEK